MTHEEIEKKALAAYPDVSMRIPDSGDINYDRKLLREGYIKALTEMKYVDMESPFTGGRVTLETKNQEIEYRGEKVKITRKYYRCEDTGNEFTDTKLDSDMMWDVFRAYWDKKNPEHFSDIDLYGAPKINGWVARDKFQNSLRIHSKKPKRDMYLMGWKSKFPSISLHNYLFPEITWESDPVEVELIIGKYDYRKRFNDWGLGAY